MTSFFYHIWPKMFKASWICLVRELTYSPKDTVDLLTKGLKDAKEGFKNLEVTLKASSLPLQQVSHYQTSSEQSQNPRPIQLLDCHGKHEVGKKQIYKTVVAVSYSMLSHHNHHYHVCCYHTLLSLVFRANNETPPLSIVDSDNEDEGAYQITFPVNPTSQEQLLSGGDEVT